MAWSYTSRTAVGTERRSGRLHVGRLLSIVRLGAAISAADAAYTPMGIGVEVDLADHRSDPTVDDRSDGRVNLVGGLIRLDGRDFSYRHSLALCVCTLCEEARRAVALKLSIARTSSEVFIYTR